MSHDQPDILRAADALEGGACRRLVLASALEELDGLDPKESGLAVFFTDWLACVEWRENEGRAFHHDDFLGAWPRELGEEANIQNRSVVWMYKDGIDVTLFNGVSLGKQFNWEVTGVYLAAGRMAAALRRAIARLNPENVEYRGLRTEYDFLDQESLVSIARTVAKEAGADFTLTKQPPANALRPEQPFDGEFAPLSRGKTLLLYVSVFMIDALSRLVGIFHAKSPKIFILHNLLVVKSLLKHLPKGAARPVLLARIHPKRPSFLAAAWSKGARLLALPNVELDAHSLRKIAQIREAILKSACAFPDGVEGMAVRRFLERHLLQGSALESRAIEVVQYRRFISQEMPRRILVGDSENHLSRLICEIAQDMGIAVDELPNGMFLTAQRMDNRSGDGFRGPVIDRYLAWGASGLRWLEKAGIAVPAVAVGYPVAESLADSPAPPPVNQGRALVLPLHVDKTDMRGLYSEVFSNLVVAVRAAIDAGYHDVRVKVHPGFFNLDYYRRLASRFGLRCEVIKDGPLLPHIAWADVVIGPLNSGALIEAAALGRRYIPLLNPPTAVLPECAAPATPVAPKELGAFLSDGLPSDNSRLILDQIAGVAPNCGAGRKIWSVLLECA